MDASLLKFKKVLVADPRPKETYITAGAATYQISGSGGIISTALKLYSSTAGGTGDPLATSFGADYLKTMESLLAAATYDSSSWMQTHTCTPGGKHHQPHGEWFRFTYDPNKIGSKTTGVAWSHDRLVWFACPEDPPSIREMIYGT